MLERLDPPSVPVRVGMFTSGDRGPYDVVVASAEDVRGPYGPRYTAITHGGHGNFFRDHVDRWWGCAFNPPGSKGGPWCSLPECRPALVPMRWENGRILPDPERMMAATR